MSRNHIMSLAGAAILTLGACGGGDDDVASPGAGEVSLDAAADGEAIASAAGAPSYCGVALTIASVDETELSDAERFGLIEDFLEALADDGPGDLRDRSGEMATHVATIAELTEGIDLETVDFDDFSPDDRGRLLEASIGLLELEDAGPEIVAAVTDGCAGVVDGDAVRTVVGLEGTLAAESADGTGGSDGADGTDGATSMDDGQPEATTADGTAAPEAVPVRFEERIAGPFGSAVIDSMRYEIVDLTWSNVPVYQWGERDAVDLAAADESNRILYVTVDLVNEDRNDRKRVQPESVSLVLDGVSYAAEQVAIDNTTWIDVDAADTDQRIFGFDVGEVVDTASATIRFDDGTVPGVIDIAPTGATASEYPIDLAPPTPGTFIGSLAASCDVPWTWTIDAATVVIDLPAEYEGGTRALSGNRFVVLDGVMQADVGEGNCTSSQGVLNSSMLRLVVDGRPFAPDIAPNTALFENEAFEFAAVFTIPVDAGTVAYAAIGPKGDGFEIPIELPALPMARGEEG